VQTTAVSITASGLSKLPGIRHGFFTRRGGVSDGIYATLNCGLGSGDDKAKVRENRSRVAAKLGATSDHLLTAHQVHSAVAVPVSGPWPDLANRPDADGLVTTTAGVAVAALTADCTPILFADPVARVVAAAHAGWKGALGGIIEATIAAMEAQGAQRKHIHAAVGPTIGPAAYEVGAEFEATFLASDPANIRFFRRPKPGAKPYFDLPGFAMSRLAAANLAHAENLKLCTYASESDFHSYRRICHQGGTDYGRQISAIVLV
jgi:polyphenol oxidase